VRYLGLSKPFPATIRWAHKIYSIAAIQVEVRFFVRFKSVRNGCSGYTHSSQYSPFVLNVAEKGHLLDTA